MALLPCAAIAGGFADVNPPPAHRARVTTLASTQPLSISEPNELWQADTTHWQLADGTDVEILNVIDDHSRLLLAADAFRTVKAVIREDGSLIRQLTLDPSRDYQARGASSLVLDDVRHVSTMS
jgi:hypothetical protein